MEMDLGCYAPSILGKEVAPLDEDTTKVTEAIRAEEG